VQNSGFKANEEAVGNCCGLGIGIVVGLGWAGLGVGLIMIGIDLIASKYTKWVSNECNIAKLNVETRCSG
jgi:hypothetical protein